MKLTFAAVFAFVATGVYGQATVRKCHTSGLKSKVSEGLSIANAICQQAANRQIPNGGSISACVPFHSDGTTDQTNYRWDLTVRHNGPNAPGVPSVISDVNACTIAVDYVLQNCGDGYLTQGGYGYISNNIIEWEIDANHEDNC